MKILVLCGDRWHPAQVMRQGLGSLGNTEFTFDYIENARDWSPEIMTTHPAVILTRSNNVSMTDESSWMSDAVQTAFSEYVMQGNGLLAIHSGTAGYAEQHVLRGLLGGVFVEHPEQCPVTMNPLPGHPVCAGTIPCTLQDEHYFMALDDPKADVFMTTTSMHGEQPGGWRQTVGAGRVGVLTPGHNLEVWLNPAFQALLLNLLRWCSKLI